MAEQSAPLACARCSRIFPVVAGIPDLRLGYADPYLSRADDLARARELEERFEDLDFEGLLREHWRRSGRPAELVRRFLARDLASAPMYDTYLAAVEEERGAPLGPSDRLLEVGCGSGGLAVSAAAQGCPAVASDVSMRWLVLAKKRLSEAGVEGVVLVCCAAEALPFLPASFSVVAATDVIEHVECQAAFARECHRVLERGGVLFLATPNRYSLALEPHVRLWGVGVLPRRLARLYVRAVRKTAYDHVRLLSSRELRHLLRQVGLQPRIVPPAVPASVQDLYRCPERWLVRAYNRARRLKAVRTLLLAVGPFFHVFAVKGKD